MDTVAKELNTILETSVVSRIVSKFGKRAFFPKGIVAQSQEAATLAHTTDATAGVALAMKHHLSHQLFSHFSSVLSIDEMVSYAPTAGDIRLRKAWLQEMVRKNPSLRSATYSLPVVTAGLTHAITIAGDLFVDEEDSVIVPQPCWDNYDQIFAVRKGCNILRPSLFDASRQFSITALVEAMNSIESDKIVLLLNFPNNPTGYTPTENEVQTLTTAIESKAKEGKAIVVIVDDAYFGLFHEDNVCKESLFARLCNLHENIFAIKCDAATKEAMVWGFRIGFITYAAKGLTTMQHDALVQKTMGAIRSSVSSCSRIGQSLLLAAMQQVSYREETDAVSLEMAKRYAIVKAEVEKRKENAFLQPYPCNSGYFCSFACSSDAELLRRYLLEHYGIGTVALGSKMLRIAYSGVDADKLTQLLETVYRSAEAVWK